MNPTNFYYFIVFDNNNQKFLGNSGTSNYLTKDISLAIPYYSFPDHFDKNPNFSIFRVDCVPTILNNEPKIKLTQKSEDIFSKQ